jgi:hypothetical protein
VLVPIATITSAILLFPSPGLAGALPQGGSRISNGDFTAASPEGNWPAGWGFKIEGNGKSWESENGKRFVRLICRKPGEVQTLYRDIKLKPVEFTGLTLNVRYRTAAVSGSDETLGRAVSLFVFRDMAGRILESKTRALSGARRSYQAANDAGLIEYHERYSRHCGDSRHAGWNRLAF